METWNDKEAFDISAKNLVELFKKNIEEYSEGLSDEIIGAGPQ